LNKWVALVASGDLLLTATIAEMLVLERVLVVVAAAAAVAIVFLVVAEKAVLVLTSADSKSTNTSLL
jgi:hypothetical protein